MTPRIDLVRVTQGYGQKGNSATFRVGGRLPPDRDPLPRPDRARAPRRGGALPGLGRRRPALGRPDRVPGLELLRRPLERAPRHAAALRQGGLLLLQRDRHRGRRVRLGRSPARRSAQILKHQFQENAALLRFYGCAPPTGDAFVSDRARSRSTPRSPTSSPSGQFPVMVDTLLRFMGHKFVVWVDPERPALALPRRDHARGRGRLVHLRVGDVQGEARPRQGVHARRVARDAEGRRRPGEAEAQRRVPEAHLDEGAGGQVREEQAQQAAPRRGRSSGPARGSPPTA